MESLLWIVKWIVKWQPVQLAHIFSSDFSFEFALNTYVYHVSITNNMRMKQVEIKKEEEMWQKSHKNHV